MAVKLDLPGARQGSRSLGKSLGRPSVGPSQQEPKFWVAGWKSNENCLPTKEDRHHVTEGAGRLRGKRGCVISLFGKKTCKVYGPEWSRRWRRVRPTAPTLAWEEGLLLALPRGSRGQSVVLGRSSPFAGCAGCGTHLLLKPRCGHWPGVCAHASHPLPACKNAVPKQLAIFWKSSGEVFSGEAKEIQQCKTYRLILTRSVTASFCFSKRNTDFRFYSPSLKISFSKEDLQLFLPVRQALPRALGTFREAASTETAQLLSHGPERRLQKGPDSPIHPIFICFFQLLHL